MKKKSLHLCVYKQVKRFDLAALFLLFFTNCPLVVGQSINLDEYKAYTSDQTSYRVGEPIVVYVMESVSAESAAGTGLSKGVDIRAGASDSNGPVSVGLGIDGSSEGSGKTARSGSIRTQISAAIVEVLPNGMFKIEGVHTVKINKEEQRVMVTGLIRSADIMKDNSVYSHRITNAEIRIEGDGDVSKAQRKSIFYNILSWLRLL